MSLSIRVDDITAVLLADGWHEVVAGSFDTDAYEYHSGSRSSPLHEAVVLYLGEWQGCSTGFTFKDANGRIEGPMTSIIAIRH